ncbi:MAG: TAT-variant-translocated molybdopterin oxidoreductase, partial [Verrucomicrobiota bacterium]
MPTDFEKARATLNCTKGKTYWRSLEELADTKEFQEILHREFPAGASELLNVDRRSFLKLMGASLALAGVTGCTRQPMEKIVPYVKQPEELVPGKPLYFATVMTLGGFATGLLVESHEGHPTKIEGNPQHPASLGATNIFHQASLLDLYDPDRSREISRNGQLSNWENFLSALNAALQTQETKNGSGLRILTETISSPTLHAQIKTLLQKFPEAKWHQYEPINRDNVYEGAKLAFGEVLETHYHFDRAKIILSLESDFLYSHPNSLRYTRDFADSRRLVGRVAPRAPSAMSNNGAHGVTHPTTTEMNRLYVVESSPSVTGSNADHRLPLLSDEIESFTFALAQKIGAIPESEKFSLTPLQAKWISAIAEDLLQNRGGGLVIAGENQPPTVHA